MSRKKKKKKKKKRVQVADHLGFWYSWKMAYKLLFVSRGGDGKFQSQRRQEKKKKAPRKLSTGRVKV